MQHEHFRELKEWSERKHALLIDYLTGSVRILGGSTRGTVYYVDGFAGPGIYDDGAKGSPVLAAEYAQKLVDKHYQLLCINVESDRECFDNLDKNTTQYSEVTVNYYGAFGDHVDEILEQVGGRPAIFFIDPFGLKGIEWEHLSPILRRSHITEILLRINPQDISRLAGFADSSTQGAAKKRQVLTNLYGFADSGLWTQVWYDEGTDGLVRLYLERLLDAMAGKRGRSYVCRYAIRTIEGQLKYYLIFATRHPKGAILMSDIVYGRERCYERDVREYEEERLEHGFRQLTMFKALMPPPTEEEIIVGIVDRLKKDIWRQFEGRTASRIDIHTAMLPEWFGRVKGAHLTRALRELEEEKRVTNRSGARSRSYTKFTFRAG